MAWAGQMPATEKTAAIAAADNIANDIILQWEYIEQRGGGGGPARHPHRASVFRKQVRTSPKGGPDLSAEPVIRSRPHGRAWP